MRKKWCWACGLMLCALSGVACGGRATSSDGGGAGMTAEMGGAPADDAPFPPRGLYIKTRVTKSDDCDWSAPLPDFHEPFISSVSKGMYFPTDNLGGQDVPWSSGYSGRIDACDVTLNIDVLSRDSKSFDLDVTEIWSSAPANCNLPAVVPPRGACTAEWLEHYELEVACPFRVARGGGWSSCN